MMKVMAMTKINIRTILSGTLLVIFLHCGCIGGAPGMNDSTFKIKDDKVLNVSLAGDVLIEKDEMTCFDSLDIAEEFRKDKTDKASTINVIHKNDKTLQFRKEVALHDEGHLELTVKIKVFPSTENIALRKVSYLFRIPSKILEGMNFKAICGRGSVCKPVEGEVNLLNSSIQQCRYIVFKGKKHKFTFDFNPAGPYSHMDYPSYGEPIGSWNIIKDGQYINFELACTAKYYGTVFMGKVFIYNDAYEFSAKHSQRRWNYAGDNSMTGFSRQFTFGTNAVIKMFEKADCVKYSPERKYGWAKADSLKVVQSPGTAITDNCVTSENGTPDEFIFDTPPGVYLISVRCGHNTLKTGPFRISVNGRTEAEKIEIPAGETKNIAFVKYLQTPENQIKIVFSGKDAWSVRSIMAQAVIFQNEDFSIDRKLWIIDNLFSPDIEFKSEKENVR